MFLHEDIISFTNYDSFVRFYISFVFSNVLEIYLLCILVSSCIHYRAVFSEFGFNITVLSFVNCRLKAGNSCYYSVQTLLSSRLLSKNLKIIIYKTIILPDDIRTIERNANVLLNVCKNIGLAVNSRKTKYMEIRRHRSMIKCAYQDR